MTRIFFAAGAIALAAAAASCGGESESRSVTGAVGAAFPGLERITESGVFDSAASKVVATSCPAGKKLVGTGGRIRAESGPPGWIGTLQSGQVGLMRIVPSESLTGVSVGAAEVVPNHLFNWAVQSYGVCETETAAHKLELVQNASATDSDARKAQNARCPDGKKLVGAGGTIAGPASESRKVALVGLAPTPDLTAARAYADEVEGGTTGDWRVVALAICAAESSVPGLELVKVTSAAESSQYKYASADCPTGKKVVGALGTALPYYPFGGALVLTGVVIHGGPIPRVSAFGAETGNGTNANWSVTAIALCANP
jgi:hypothetical protein